LRSPHSIKREATLPMRCKAILTLYTQASFKQILTSIYLPFIHSFVPSTLPMPRLALLAGSTCPSPGAPTAPPPPRAHLHPLPVGIFRSAIQTLQSVSKSVRGHCRTKDSHRQLARNYILRRIFLLYMAVYKAHLFRHLGRIINR